MKQKMNIIGKQIKMGTKRNLSLEFYSSKSWHAGISFIGCVELIKYSFKMQEHKNKFIIKLVFFYYFFILNSFQLKACLLAYKIGVVFLRNKFV